MLDGLVSLALATQMLSGDVAPKFMNGIHSSCEASFEVAVEDTAYHQGQSVAGVGSFALYLWPDGSRFFVGMKLGILKPDGTWQGPSNAYLVNGYRSNIAEQQGQTDAENEGFRLFIFDPAGDQTVLSIGRLSALGELEVAYTLNGGSMPMTFVATYDQAQRDAWSECVDALVTRDGEN